MSKFIPVPTLDSDCLRVCYSLELSEPIIWTRNKTTIYIRRFPEGFFNWFGLFDKSKTVYSDWFIYHDPRKEQKK